MKIRGMKKFNEVNGYEKFKVKIRGAKKRLRGAKISMENLRGAKISMENLRGAKISVENLRGLKLQGVKFHIERNFRVNDTLGKTISKY